METAADKLMEYDGLLRAWKRDSSFFTLFRTHVLKILQYWVSEYPQNEVRQVDLLLRKTCIVYWAKMHIIATALNIITFAGNSYLKKNVRTSA